MNGLVDMPGILYGIWMSEITLSGTFGATVVRHSFMAFACERCGNGKAERDIV